MTADERKEYLREYRVAHHAEHLAYCHARYLARHEEYLAKRREYYAEHRDECVSYDKGYNATHHLENWQWQIEHPERVSASHLRYTRGHPDKVGAWNAYRRTLGFILLNDAFIGGVGHHLDREHVVYIPRVLHQSISHNVWTGKNMDKINIIAEQWVTREVPNVEG